MNKDVVYEIIRDKFLSSSFNGRLKTERARYILALLFHFPKNKHSEILHVMHEMRFITLSNSTYISIPQYEQLQKERRVLA